MIMVQGHPVFVNRRDAHLLTAHTWRVVAYGKTFYVTRSEGSRTLLLHREIVGASEGELMDHKDGNGLNNVRRNIRSATMSQNQSNRTRLNTNNTSGSVGVFWDKKLRKWGATIKAKGKTVVVAHCSTMLKAVRYRRAAEALVYGSEWVPKHLERELTLVGKYTTLRGLQMSNRKGTTRRGGTGASGVEGVIKVGKKWVVRTSKAKGSRSLGTFTDLGEAAAVARRDRARA